MELTAPASAPEPERPAGERRPGATRRDPLPAVLLSAAFLYALATIDRGWIPHDEGTLAQAAVRVLTGELPHRDFHDMYTGGLSYWHALSFALFGIHLMAPRILLLVAFGAFLLLSNAVARRFAAPRTAAATVLLAAVWSLPNYPAAMPTWYNLFLAVFALWCLFRFLETPRLSWLVAAGLACGLSIIVKVIGLYTLAAVLIGLVLIEADERHDTGPGASVRPTLYTGVIAVGLGVYAMLVFWLVRARLDPATVFHFVVPSAAVAAAASWRVGRTGDTRSVRARVMRLTRLIVPVLAGATVPVALFVIPYVVTGSIVDLAGGTLVLPRRLEFASGSPPPLRLSWTLLVPLGLAALSAVASGRARVGALAVLAGVLSATLALGGRDVFFRAAWAGLRLVPVVAALAALAWAMSAWRRGDETRRPLLATLTAAQLGTFVLVQYPFSGPVYFFYVAPLVALTALAAFSVAPIAWRAAGVMLYAFVLPFMVIWVGSADLVPIAQLRYERRPPVERIALERGRIRVAAAERLEYETLVGMLSQLETGGVTFATPDAPEVYFLSGLRNPTPVFFDFLDDPSDRTARTLATLERENVRVIVLNTRPGVSGPPPPDLLAALEEGYPRAARAGRFIVRWR